MITTKQIKEWIELHNEGYNCARIAERYGCSRSTVQIYLNQAGIDTSHYTQIKSKYYKNKYNICVYDDQDILIYQFNNLYEMSKTTGKSVEWLRSRLNPKRINMKFRHKKKWCHIHLIEIDTTKEE